MLIKIHWTLTKLTSYNIISISHIVKKFSRWRFLIDAPQQTLKIQGVIEAYAYDPPIEWQFCQTFCYATASTIASHPVLHPFSSCYFFSEDKNTLVFLLQPLLFTRVCAVVFPHFVIIYKARNAHAWPVTKFGHFLLDVILQYLYRIPNRHRVCNRVPLDVYIAWAAYIYR